MHDNYRYKKQNGGDTFFAFVAGIAIGVASALLANRENREKVIDTFEDVKKKGAKMLSETQKKAQEVSTDATAKVDEARRDVAKRIDKK